MTKKDVERQKKQRHKARVAEKEKKQKRVRTVMLTTVAVILLAVIALLIYFIATGSSQNQSSLLNGEKVSFHYKDQPMLGDKDAPVKIVEFGDYKCPACRAFDESILPLIKTNFIETGKVSYYFMYKQVIPGSKTAALAAEAMYAQGNDLYWQYHDAIFEHQKKESKDWATPEYLVKLAKKYVPEADIDQLKQDIKEKTYKDEMMSDLQKAQSAGVRATPTIFVNGHKLQGLSYQMIKRAIEKALDNESS